MAWYIPFSKLSQTQQACIDDVTKNIDGHAHFISGFAGSGKSVVLAHTLQRLRADRPNASFTFLSYTHALVGMARTALASAGLDDRSARGITFSTVHKFMNAKEMVDFVFVDEVQDLELAWLEAIKARSRHVVLAGDYEQSIYDHGASKEQMLELFSPRTHELREVFRLTTSLKKLALSINPAASKIVEADPVNSVDADIREIVFDTFADEVKWVSEEALKRARAGRPSALLFSHHHELQNFFREVANIRGVSLPQNHPASLQERYIDLNEAFKNAGVPMSYYGNGAGSLNFGEKSPHCYLMTIHSAKGLDFKNVFLPSLHRVAGNGDLQPFAPRVCFVGVTRSVENLFLSRTGQAVEPPFDKLPDDVVTRVQPRDSATENDIFF